MLKQGNFFGIWTCFAWDFCFLFLVICFSLCMTCGSCFTDLLFVDVELMGLCFWIQILPSPTTGAFVSQSFNWKSSSGGNRQIVKEEDKSFSNFSFQTQPRPPASSTVTYQSSNVAVQNVRDPFQCIIYSFKQNSCLSLVGFLHYILFFSKFSIWCLVTATSMEFSGNHKAR